ncbi:hypothetical protein PLGE761_17510 [Pluralibacter gergoviae]|nr:Uncharacterised protein [Pluralibacter gergoviae]
MPEPVNVFYEGWGERWLCDRPHRPPANCI